MKTETQFSILSSDLSIWEIGPFHGALPAPFKMRLKVDGEIIVSAQVEAGFLTRGLEAAMQRSPWEAQIVYADHLDAEASAFAELAYCLAAEKLGKIDVPTRAQSVRLVLCELSRISSHLAFAARLARRVGGDTVAHYILRDRERILDLFELLTGARFSLNFLRLGGIRLDVTEGFIERVFEATDLIRERLKEYNDIFSFNTTFVRRSTGVGILNREQILEAKVSGPNARASGVLKDIRKESPYSGYDRVDFHDMISTEEGAGAGDCHERFLIRLREVSQSIDILRQVAEKIPSGPWASTKVTRGFVLPSGEAEVVIESSRGALSCHLVSNGGESPQRVEFKTPSTSIFGLIPEVIRGIQIEDLPMVLASLDLSLSEVDR